MHIAWLNERADFLGGAERYVHSTARALREVGAQSTLLHAAGTWIGPGYTAPFGGAFPAVDLERQLEQLAPDVVYVHQWGAVDAIRLLAASRYPTIRFLHDHWLFCLRRYKYRALGHETCTRTLGLGCYPCLGFVQRDPGPFKVRLRTLGEAQRELDQHRGLDAFVVGSEYMRAHVVAHGFPRDKVHVLPLPVSAPPRVTGVERARDRLLFVGALLRGKGLDTLLGALARLPSAVTLDVIGEGHQRAMFEDLARDLGLSGRVRFAGNVGRDELARYLAETSCVVVPSREPETFGFVGPEALLSGAPVVATDVGGTGEWLRHEQTGLAVPSNDPERLAEAIQRTLADPTAAAERTARGHELCAERFTEAQHMAGLLSLFQTLGAAR